MEQKQNEVDMVNHPPHYTDHPSGVECIEVFEWCSGCTSTAWKYMWCGGKKWNDLEDLKKAQWYIRREIQFTHALQSRGLIRQMLVPDSLVAAIRKVLAVESGTRGAVMQQLADWIMTGHQNVEWLKAADYYVARMIAETEPTAAPSVVIMSQQAGGNIRNISGGVVHIGKD